MVNKSFTNLGMVLVMAAAIASWPHGRASLLEIPQFVSYLWQKDSQQGAVPAVIRNRDRDLYRGIFKANQKNEWAKAGELESQLSDPLLMGHVLAERYLSPLYKPTSKELSGWLERYSDHPEAYTIYSLSLAKAGETGVKPEPVKKRKILAGYGTHSADSVRFSPEKTPAWQAGMQAWRSGDKAAAARLFVAVSHGKGLSAWQEAAASYWSWRALDAIGEKQEARKYLRRAAAHGHSFYSILARRQLGQDMSVAAQSIALSDTDIVEMIGEPVVRRAIALAHVGQVERAENELRYAFPMADDTGKMRLLALAHDLKLASVQMSMANQLKKNNGLLDSAMYPVPQWQPYDGFKVDPALIYALARQESGFQAKAVSPAGAKGVMQLMPQTASMMKKSLGITADAARVSDPALNITLGQNYVRHLLDHNVVDNNLVYMLVAYNAGIARLIDWKKTADQTDPLLFIESIPYGETRAYVMQVMTNYWVYSDLLGGTDRSVVALAQGRWPSHDAAFASTIAVDNNS